jgi:hypothetical protein
MNADRFPVPSSQRVEDISGILIPFSGRETLAHYTARSFYERRVEGALRLSS